MDRLESMRVFVAVADGKGFASAARRLRMSAPSVTRAVAALEAHLGVRLFQRTTRLVRLTEAGARFAVDARRILAEVEEAERSAAGDVREARGPLAVTASVTFGRRYLGPLLVAFLGEHPRVNARCLLVDRVVDLVEEGIDVAIRIAHLPDSTLSAVRVGTVRRRVCASPEYLARHGTPRTPEELVHHAIVDFTPSGSPPTWSFEDAVVVPRSRLAVNTSDVALEAALAGHGITRGLSYVVDPLLREGKLHRVLAEHEPPPIPIHVVHAHGPRPPAKVRAFVDFVVERLRAEKLR